MWGPGVVRRHAHRRASVREGHGAAPAAAATRLGPASKALACVALFDVWLTSSHPRHSHRPSVQQTLSHTTTPSCLHHTCGMLSFITSCNRPLSPPYPPRRTQRHTPGTAPDVRTNVPAQAAGPEWTGMPPPSPHEMRLDVSRWIPSRLSIESRHTEIPCGVSAQTKLHSHRHHPNKQSPNWK